MLESGFNEVAGLKVSNFTKKRARGKFPSHTLKVFFFFMEHLWTAASVIGHVALLAPDQEDRTSRLKLFC